MKRKILWLLLLAEAALAVALRLLQDSLSGLFSAALAFPFEQTGLLLRALSLSGWAGNLAALLIYAAVCLTPAAVLAVLVKRRGFLPEDWLLVLFSASLFGALYLMINPAILGSLFGPAAGLAAGKGVLGSVLYSVLCGYAVLRLLRLLFAGSTGKLLKVGSALLCLLNLLFVWLAFGSCFGKLLDSLAALQAGNAGNENLLGASYAFLVLQYLVDALPYMLDVFVVVAALRALDELRADRYSEQSVTAVSRLARLCGAALAATVLANIAFNVLQLLFARSLNVINTTVQMPLFSIAFVLAVLLVARLITENKRLKDDNDMFV